MPIDIQIRANADQANIAFKKFTADTEKEAARVSARTKERFKDMAINISQNFSGAAAQIVGGLGRIPGVAGFAVAAVTGLAGAMLRLAENTAEATKETSSGSRSFLTGMENLKTRVQDNINIIGGQAISIFNSFFDLIGVGATKQQLLNAETKRYNDLIVTTVAKTDEYIGKIKEFLIATDRLDEATITRDYFEAIAAGRNDLANAYFKQLSNQKILQVETKNAAANEKKLLEEIARENERIEKEKAEKRKALAEDIMGTIKRLSEAEREEMRKSIEAADKALQRDRTEFQEELGRQRAGLKSPEDVERAVNEEIQKGADALREEVQLANQLANSIAQAALNAKDFSDFTEQAIRAILSMILQITLAKALGPFSSFLPFQHGGIVQRPTRALIGEAGPEAVVPLSPNKASQREAVMQAAGLSGGGGSVTLNISMPNVRKVDQLAIRNELLPEINKQIRRGEKLLASKLRS